MAGELELIKRLGAMRGALGEMRARRLFDEIPNALEWYQARALEKGLMSKKAAFSKMNPYDFLDSAFEVPRDFEETVQELEKIANSSRFRGWRQIPRLELTPTEDIRASWGAQPRRGDNKSLTVTGHQGRHRAAITPKDSFLARLKLNNLTSEGDAIPLVPEDLGYDESIELILDTLKNRPNLFSQEHPLTGDQTKLSGKSMFKPFAYGGRV